MAFDNLSEKLNHVFSKMREKGKLTDLEVKQAMREIRVALLEADVNYQVAKDLTARSRLLKSSTTSLFPLWEARTANLSLRTDLLRS